MSNNQFSQNGISHKELNAFLIKAKKEFSSIDTYENTETKENNDLKDLITNWTETSHKLLMMLNNNKYVSDKEMSSKSLMAFGAMGAHINMALQALKAAESNE